MWRIFVPLRYLWIDHPEKRKFDVYLPLAIGAFFSLALLSDNFRHDALGSLDIVGKISSFLGVLTGFFIAALAAVATFGKAEMDDPMPGDPPLRLEHRRNAETFFENLTRRRFLSLLFGYMSFMSLTLYVVGYVYLVLDKYLIATTFINARPMIFSIFWIAYSICIANILSNTYLGLFYLCDRIHRQIVSFPLGAPQSPSTRVSEHKSRPPTPTSQRPHPRRFGLPLPSRSAPPTAIPATKCGDCAIIAMMNRPSARKSSFVMTSAP
jgi:hypothetical protein